MCRRNPCVVILVLCNLVSCMNCLVYGSTYLSNAMQQSEEINTLYDCLLVGKESRTSPTHESSIISLP